MHILVTGYFMRELANATGLFTGHIFSHINCTYSLSPTEIPLNIPQYFLVVVIFFVMCGVKWYLVSAALCDPIYNCFKEVSYYISPSTYCGPMTLYEPVNWVTRIIKIDDLKWTHQITHTCCPSFFQVSSCWLCTFYTSGKNGWKLWKWLIMVLFSSSIIIYLLT